jgi:hypothetical protein
MYVFSCIFCSGTRVSYGYHKRRSFMYANLKLHEVEKLRKIEKELGVVLIAYREERGYVPSQGKYTSTSP